MSYDTAAVKYVSRFHSGDKMTLGLRDLPIGEEMEVTAFEPPHRYALGCENHGCRYHSEFLFTPRDSGTDVEMTFEATPLTFFAKVMSFVMGPMMRSMEKQILKDLDDLKTAVEADV